MIKPWLRQDTQEWISLIECRLEDFEYYKREAVEWCKTKNITDSDLITLCMITACIWVSNMRSEEISFGEIYDVIGSSDFYSANTHNVELINFNDAVSFKPGIADVELEDLLEEVVNDKLNS